MEVENEDNDAFEPIDRFLDRCVPESSDAVEVWLGNALGSSPLPRLSYQQLEQVVRERAGDRECFIFCTGGDRPTSMTDAEKVAWLACRMPKLRRLLINYREGEPGRWAVDWLFRRLAFDSTAHLDHLQLEVMGYDSVAWRRFVSRHASSIKSLEVDGFVFTETMTSELSRSLQQSRFSSLETFTLNFRYGTNNAEKAKKMLKAVPNSPIRDLKVQFYGDVLDASPSMECVGEVASRCKCLKTVEVSDNAGGYDGSVILERLLRSESLEEITLSIPLGSAAGHETRRGLDAPIANHSVKKISLNGCILGEDAVLHLISFKRVESIAFKDVKLAFVPSPNALATRSFANHTHLLRFSNELSYTEADDEEAEEESTAFNLCAEWVASNLVIAPSLREVQLLFDHGSVSIPALEESLINCKGKLSIHDVFLFNVSSLCRGIRAARSLNSLRVSIEDFSLEAAEMILDAVSRNRSLLRFECDFQYDEPVQFDEPDEIRRSTGRALERFISTNRALRFFGFTLSDHDDATKIDAVASVVRGLRHNRCLHGVDFSPPSFRDSISRLEVNEAIGAAIVEMLEEGNTTLQRIDGLDYESREHEEKIGNLLALNRYALAFPISAHRVPMDLWGDVLSRISNEECNETVTELVQRAVSGDGDDLLRRIALASGRKRRRSGPSP